MTQPRADPFTKRKRASIKGDYRCRRRLKDPACMMFTEGLHPTRQPDQRGEPMPTPDEKPPA